MRPVFGPSPPPGFKSKETMQKSNALELLMQAEAKSSHLARPRKIRKNQAPSAASSSASSSSSSSVSDDNDINDTDEDTCDEEPRTAPVTAEKPPGVKRKRGHGRKTRKSEPKNVSPTKRIQSFPCEPFKARGKDLICEACGCVVHKKQSLTKQHIETRKHKGPFFFELFLGG
jgi:hypothetical protein